MLTLKNYLSKFSCHPEPFDLAQGKRSEGSHSLKARFFVPIKSGLRMTKSITFTLPSKGRKGWGQFRSRGSFPQPKSINPLRILSYPLILLIKIYQNSIALIFPRSCRFYPSCSEYGILALKKFGTVKGSWLTIKRIGKCHPFHPGGYDPI